MATQKIETGLIADSAVTTAKLADNSVTAAKIAAGSLDDQVKGISSSADAVAITIDSSENVGIGTDNPDYKLHIEGTGNNLKLSRSGVGEFAIGVASGRNLVFEDKTAAAERMRIDSSGNVVINKSEFSSLPTGSKLNVFGDGEVFRIDGSGATSRTIRFRNVGTNGSSNGIIMSDGSLQLKNEDANAAIYFNSVRDMEFQVTSGNGTAGNMTFLSYNTEIMRIDGANNRVGIGETDPETSLHIKNSGNSFLTLERSGTTGGTGKFGINMEGGSSQQTTMAYDDGGKLVIGRSSDPATHAGFSNDFVLDSSGNCGIGTTSPAQLLEVHKNAGGDQTVAKFSAHNYGDTGKTFIEIGTEYGDGSSRIGSFNDTGNSSVLVFDVHSATSGQFSEKMRIKSDGQITTQGDILPGADVIMANGRGISFTATGNSSGSMSSELLDDYEEGAWTPDIKRNDGTVSAAFTVASGTATYVKIGRLVYVKAFVNTVSDGSSNGSSYWRINGVPFAGKQYSALLLGYNNTPADGVYIGDAGGNFILTVGAAPFYGSFGSNKEFMLAFTYETDS